MAAVTIRSLLLPFFVLGLAASACKDDGPPTLDSGISGTKQGDELTPAEQTQFCEAADAFGDEVFPASEQKAAGCTFTAIFAALTLDGSENTCNVLRDECLAQPADPEPATCDLGVDWATCMATIDEIEACYEEYTQDYVELMRSLSCAKMAEYKAAAPEMGASLDTACSSAKAKCPTILGV